MKKQETQVQGQMSFYDYIDRTTKAHDVKIKGLCDDAYCPECDYPLDEVKELDCEVCPRCGLKISWARWHKANDC